MNSPQPNPRITLVIVIVAIASSVGIYALLVYVIQPVRSVSNPLPPALPKVLGAIAIISFFVGMALESYLLGKATAPGQVMAAAIVSCACGEVVAIMGLVLYLLTGDTGRFTPFLIGSVAYFAALFLRFPRFGSRMEDSGGS